MITAQTGAVNFRVRPVRGRGLDQVVHADKLKKYRVWDNGETVESTDNTAVKGGLADETEGNTDLNVRGTPPGRPHRPIKRPIRFQ